MDEIGLSEENGVFVVFGTDNGINGKNVELVGLFGRSGCFVS